MQAEGMAQAVKSLLSRWKSLSSIPSTTKNKQKTEDAMLCSMKQARQKREILHNLTYV
jgi:hypothetical protein